jgi:hypothetical protein
MIKARNEERGTKNQESAAAHGAKADAARNKELTTKN